MRKVEYTVQHKDKPNEVKIGTFHKFSTDFMEYEAGPAQFPVAIIEESDGKIVNIPTELVEFIIIEPAQKESPYGSVGKELEKFATDKDQHELKMITPWCYLKITKEQ